MTAIQVAGAAYLVSLGLQRLRRPAGVYAPEVAGASRSGLFWQGMVVDALNPKTALFFLAFLPQFVGGATAPTLQLIMLGAVFLVVAAIWEITVVLAAARIAAVSVNESVWLALPVSTWPLPVYPTAVSVRVRYCVSCGSETERCATRRRTSARVAVTRALRVPVRSVSARTAVTRAWPG